VDPAVPVNFLLAAFGGTGGVAFAGAALATDSGTGLVGAGTDTVGTGVATGRGTTAFGTGGATLSAGVGVGGIFCVLAGPASSFFRSGTGLAATGGGWCNSRTLADPPAGLDSLGGTGGK
jgi:hypothetical protein